MGFGDRHMPRSSFTFGGCICSKSFSRPLWAVLELGGDCFTTWPAPSGETAEPGELSAWNRLLQLLEQSPPSAALQGTGSRKAAASTAPAVHQHRIPAWARRGSVTLATGTSAALPSPQRPLKLLGTKDSGDMCLFLQQNSQQGSEKKSRPFQCWQTCWR